MSKGSRQRKIQNKKQFEENWDKIFGRKKTPKHGATQRHKNKKKREGSSQKRANEAQESPQINLEALCGRCKGPQRAAKRPPRAPKRSPRALLGRSRGPKGCPKVSKRRSRELQHAFKTIIGSKNVVLKKCKEF